MTGSLSQIVICNEILTWVKRALHPVEITTETLALELVNQTGPDGQYLDKKHTVRHFRDQWHPLLFERNNHEGWVNKDSKTLAERAAERVNEILYTHKTEPLPEKVKGELRAIVENANH